MEIGLTSDICVGGAVGGTASLEAALSGTRSVLINEYYLPSKWDILSRKNIVFLNFEDFINGLYKENKWLSDDSDIGDWSSFIDFYDPYNNYESYSRIYDAVIGE